MFHLDSFREMDKRIICGDVSMDFLSMSDQAQWQLSTVYVSEPIPAFSGLGDFWWSNLHKPDSVFFSINLALPVTIQLFSSPLKPLNLQNASFTSLSRTLLNDNFTARISHTYFLSSGLGQY